MDNSIERIIPMLRKVLPLLIENPDVMTGCDISSEEINEIHKNQNISLEVLRFVAEDHFFDTYYADVGITKKEAIEISAFLNKNARYFIRELQTEFPFLVK